MLDSTAVHTRAGHRSTNKAQTANAWKAAGRILGLPFRNRTLFPAFQFDADGQPHPLMKAVLAALPEDMTPWQRAFWLVAPDVQLDGEVPHELVRQGDDRVVAAARDAGRLPIG